MSPLVRPHRVAEVSGTLCRGLLDRKRICWPLFRLESPRRRSPDVWRRTSEGGSYWVERCHTVPISPQFSQGIGLLTLPVFLGRSRPQRASLSVCSARECSGAEKLAPSSEVSRSSCSNCTRDQSRETDSLSRLFSSVESTAQCVSVGPAHDKGRVSYSIQHPAATLQRGHSYSGRSRAGSGYGTGSRHAVKEGGHRGGPSSRERVRILQPVLHSSKEGWRTASYFRSASTEPLSHATEVQDAHTQAGCVSDQVRGLVCHDRSKRRILPCLHPFPTQKVPEVHFRGRSVPISSSSLQPRTLTSHFHEVCGCCTGPITASRHPSTELHRRLVDFSSLRADGGSTLRCRARQHESFGVKTKRQEKFLLSWCRLGQSFVCTLFPRSLCSQEFWQECAGMRTAYCWLHRFGRAEYGSWT